MLSGAFGGPYSLTAAQALRILKEGPAIIHTLLSFRETALGLLLGHNRVNVDHGPPGYHVASASHHQMGAV